MEMGNKLEEGIFADVVAMCTYSVHIYVGIYICINLRSYFSLAVVGRGRRRRRRRRRRRMLSLGSMEKMMMIFLADLLAG